MKQMKKLLVAVDFKERICFLENFPDDEEHWGLHEYIDESYGDFEANPGTKPGLYLATLRWMNGTGDYYGESEAYLDIDNLEPLETKTDVNQLKTAFGLAVGELTTYGPYTKENPAELANAILNQAKQYLAATITTGEE